MHLNRYQSHVRAPFPYIASESQNAHVISWLDFHWRFEKKSMAMLLVATLFTLLVRAINSPMFVATLAGPPTFLVGVDSPLLALVMIELPYWPPLPTVTWPCCRLAGRSISKLSMSCMLETRSISIIKICFYSSHGVSCLNDWRRFALSNCVLKSPISKTLSLG